MIKIVTLYFIFLSFCLSAQVKDNDINVLQNKISQYERLGDTINKNYVISLNNLGAYFQDQKDFSKAEKIYLKTIKIRQNHFGLDEIDIAKSLIHLSDLYYDQKKYFEAEPLCTRVLEIRKRLLGENSLEYIKTIGKMASIYLGQKKYNEAENLFFLGLKLKSKNFGENDSSYLVSLTNLANLYFIQGKYSEAEIYYLKILELKKKTIGETNEDYIYSLNYLSEIYYYEGKYIEAEKGYIKVIKLTEEVLGKEKTEYAIFLNNLAELYVDLMQYNKSEDLLNESIKIYENINENNTVGYYISLSNLAILYVKKNKLIEAEQIFIKTLEFTKKNYGEKDANYATSLQNLGGFYSNLGRYKDALNYVFESSEIRKKILGEKHPLYALSLYNLGNIYSALSDYSTSLSYYLKSLEIHKEIADTKNPDYISILSSLAENYQDLDLNDKAKFYYDEFINAKQEKIFQDFYGLTSKEIINFESLDRVNLIRPFSFLAENSIKYPSLNLDLFNGELLFKKITLIKQERIKNSIQKSNNLFLQKKYQKFVENKRQITRYNELPLNEKPKDLNNLLNETEKIEKDLTVESNTFSDYQKAMTISFTDLKNRLKKEEVVIDLVSFKYYNKTVTDSLVYAAFIVKKDSNFPKFISLFEEKQLDFLLSTNKSQQDKTRIDNQYLDKSICDLFLKPLEKELEGITTIYLSPSGLGHQIDFAALPICESQTLGDNYKLHILNAPSELIDYKETGLEHKNKPEILLYGGINYGKSNAKEKLENAVAEVSEEFLNNKTRSSIAGFDYLDGTNKEVNQIQQRATKNGFITALLNESAATEESIKSLDGKTSPYILHLATHGFFFADPQTKDLPKNIIEFEGKVKVYKTSEDPMMRSGLVFAGANNYWSKANENASIDDGILTASEISNLDLSACQLVVLSACETGLGEVKGSEGVFGLQRAFKMAGVKNIIMSLWKVPDTQTAELFDIFYSECFAGKTIHEAFQSAQSQMKVKYSPYYWAGFVLLE
jgi:CHAT domain-containing protein